MTLTLAVDLSFIRSMPHLQLGHWAADFGKALAAHPGHQEPEAFPKIVPAAPEITEVANNFIGISMEVDAGNKSKKTQRDAMRPLVEQTLAITIHWISMRSIRENKPSLLENLGLPAKKAKAKSSTTEPVDAPTGVTVTHVPNKEGATRVKMRKVRNARFYEVWICRGDPSLESSWYLAATGFDCRNIEVAGLEPGQVYYFRVRCCGPAGNSPWSSVVSLRIL